MKHEAKFSVILPAGSFKSSQTEAFEQAVQHYSIPAKLPLYTDAKGNYVVSSGLCLRDAQLLRRQVSGCGFPADVVSDSAEAAAAAAKATELKELKSELSNVNVDSLKIDSDLPSDAWGSMELPSSLDLGLNDGEDLEKKSDWSGDNWLSPDTSEHTLSVSAEVLLQKAKESAVDLPPVTGDELKNAQNGKDTAAKTTSATEKAKDTKASAASDKATSDANASENNAAGAEKSAQDAQKKAEEQSTRTASYSPPPEILSQATAEPKKEADSASKPSDAKKEESKKDSADNKSKALAKTAGPEMTVPETTESKSLPTDTIMMVTLAVVVICLILALVSAFVSPITALVSPLF